MLLVEAGVVDLGALPAGVAGAAGVDAVVFGALLDVVVVEGFVVVVLEGVGFLAAPYQVFKPLWPVHAPSLTEPVK